jgi:hypothetical protein
VALSSPGLLFFIHVSLHISVVFFWQIVFEPPRLWGQARFFDFMGFGFLSLANQGVIFLRMGHEIHLQNLVPKGRRDPQEPWQKGKRQGTNLSTLNFPLFQA